MRKRGFLYGIPNLEPANGEGVKKHLAYLDAVQVREITNGPGENVRSVFSIADAPMPAFYPDKQEWKCCNGGKLWIGWTTDAPPRPEDLIRAEPTDGTLVRLADGHDWLVPRLKFFPWIWEWSTNGEKEQVYARQYRKLVDDTQAAYDDYQNINTGGVKLDRMLDIIARAISVNYFAGEAELVALGAIGNAELERAFVVLTGHDEWLAAIHARADAEKKSDTADTPE